jgi:uncharacterized membrane-anchored protein YjiN (DUF445 family)
VTSPSTTYDLERAQELRRARRRASGLLLLATAVFASTFTLGDATWVGFLRSTAEAAMIGGVADWFAVTALFRHPFGIPIPHTAIIPRSKTGLARSLGEFVRYNFLEPSQLVERIRAADLPRRTGEWLSADHNADVLAGQIAAVVGAVAEGLDSDAVEESLETFVLDRLQSLPMAEMVGKGIEAAVVAGQHQSMMEGAIRGLASTLEENRETLRRWVGEQSPWWVPEVVDDAVFARGFDALVDLIHRIASDPNHEIRRTLDLRLVEVARRLQTDPDLAGLVSERIDAIASQPEIRQWARELWSQLTTGLADAASRTDSPMRGRIANALRQLGKRLTADPDLRKRVDAWLESLAPPLARVGQNELADIIAVTIERWDPEETSRRLELWMGRDLQFVRINGTVVGGLVGLAIHTLVFAIGG